MKTIIEIKFNPKKNSLLQIEEWLIKEYNEKREGFYCNWTTIIKYFEQKTLAVITLNNEAIGFVCWYNSNYVARIEIMEVSPIYRKQYFGHLLFNQLNQYFIKKGIYVISLACAPAESEKFWKKLNFIEFPLHEHFIRNDKNLYRITIPTESEPLNINNEFIELWEAEQYLIKNEQPDKIWEVNYKEGSNQLINPIIFPAHHDWRIRWRKGNEIIIDDKVKYFGKNKIYFDRFIIITKLIV